MTASSQWGIITIVTSITILALGPATVHGQVSLTGSTYSQSFDSLAASGTANPWTDNGTLVGWYAAAERGFGDYRAGTGSSTTGDLYSFGIAGTTERALGSIPTDTTGGIAYGVRFRNESSQTLGQFHLSFIGEQWRNAGAAAQSLGLSYRVSSSPITDLDLGSASTWTALTGLTFSSPITGAPAGALDGNLAANRTAFNDVTIAGLTLDPGQELMFRWLDSNESGSDHGLSIDDVQLTYAEYSAVPEPGPSALVAALGLVCLAVYRRTARSAPSVDGAN